MEIRIYVADLKSYNEGRLTGEWLTLPMDSDELDAIMNRLTHDGQHDYAIHDYEAPFDISEYNSPWKLNEMAETFDSSEVEEDVLEVILSNASTLDDALNIIESQEFRVWDDCNDMEDVAMQKTEESGEINDLPNHITMYINYVSMGEDMEINGTFWKGDGFYIEVFH